MNEENELHACTQIDRLKSIDDNLMLLLKRGNDFKVKVINGVTQERWASELIGEMYLGMKELKNDSTKRFKELEGKTVEASTKKFKEKMRDLVSFGTLVLIVLTLIKNWIIK